SVGARRRRRRLADLLLLAAPQLDLALEGAHDAHAVAPAVGELALECGLQDRGVGLLLRPGGDGGDGAGERVRVGGSGRCGGGSCFSAPSLRRADGRREGRLERIEALADGRAVTEVEAVHAVALAAAHAVDGPEAAVLVTLG